MVFRVQHCITHGEQLNLEKNSKQGNILIIIKLKSNLLKCNPEPQYMVTKKVSFLLPINQTFQISQTLSIYHITEYHYSINKNQ